MRAIRLMGLSCVVAFAFAQTADAKVVNIKNSMGARIEVSFTAVGSTLTRKLVIGPNKSAPFTFADAGEFDIQTRPADEPNSGYNADPVVLADFDGGEFVVGGILGAPVKKCYHYRRFFRWHCSCYMAPERVAATFSATSPSGKTYSSQASKMQY